MISRTLDFALLAVSMEGGSWYRLQALAKVTWSMFLVPKSLNGTFGDLDGTRDSGSLVMAGTSFAESPSVAMSGCDNGLVLRLSWSLFPSSRVTSSSN